jgi:hypothetical protein
MVEYLADQDVPLKYSPYHREYQIVAKSDGFVITIDYCPWCGTKLPNSLRNVWGERLDALGFLDPYGEDRASVPDAFWSDSWWREAKL